MKGEPTKQHRKCLNRFGFQRLYGAFALLILAPAMPSFAVDHAESFSSSTTVAETLQRLSDLPKDEIWWSVNGEAMRWYNLNLQSFEPTVTVHRAGPVRALDSALNPAIAQYPVETPNGLMPFQTFLDSEASTTMGVVILHQGRVVFEDYPRQQPHDQPLFWSVTKALTSTVLAILEDRGEVDVSRTIDSYIPVLQNTAYAGVTVRAILDMASGVDCGDGDYLDRSTCYYGYSESIGEAFRTPDAAENPYEYVASLKPSQRFAEPGRSYAYSGVDTFVAGWLVEVLTGMPFQDALSREVWTQMGAESDALIWAGHAGVALTSGGLMARLRDVARFGLLFTPSYGKVAGRRVISERYVELILHGGNPSLMENSRWGNILQEGERHNVYQWDKVWENDDFIKGGWAGQGLLINPRKDLVAVWTGYYNAEGQEISVEPMIRQIFAEHYPDGQ